MVRPQTIPDILGGRTGTDTKQYSAYDAERIIVQLVKRDGSAVGQVGATGAMVKPFTYDRVIRQTDVPNRAYLWLPPDAGATAHETMTGTVMTVGGTGIVPGTMGAPRYAGQMGQLSSNGGALMAGGTFLETAENSAQSWTLGFWVYRQANAAAATCYIETNVGLTTYLAVICSTTGQLTVQQSGVVKWTGPAATIPFNAWTYVVLVYSAGGATIQQFVNGVSSGAPAAYTRLTTWPGGEIIWNSSANSQLILAAGEVYQNVAFVADDALRHYEDMTVDSLAGAFVQTGANLTKGTAVTIVFSTDITPGYDAATQTITMPLTPAVAVYSLQGVYYCEATILLGEE